jgi:hypothetical protein
VLAGLGDRTLRAGEPGACCAAMHLPATVRRISAHGRRVAAAWRPATGAIFPRPESRPSVARSDIAARGNLGADRRRVPSVALYAGGRYTFRRAGINLPSRKLPPPRQNFDFPPAASPGAAPVVWSIRTRRRGCNTDATTLADPDPPSTRSRPRRPTPQRRRATTPRGDQRRWGAADAGACVDRRGSEPSGGGSSPSVARARTFRAGNCGGAARTRVLRATGASAGASGRR